MYRFTKVTKREINLNLAHVHFNVVVDYHLYVDDVVIYLIRIARSSNGMTSVGIVLGGPFELITSLLKLGYDLGGDF
jgi:hypothetical protein